MPKSLKDPTTYTEQLARFQSRNMVVDDEAKALLDLRACNYYRVCGYCYQFFNAKGNYKNGTSFEVVICQKTFRRCRRGRSPSDFSSCKPALPASRVVDFACKINSLQIRATSG